MNKLNEVLSSKLPELMKESGVSRRDLAEYCGVSYNTVRCWEVGTKAPRPDMVVKIAERFNLKPFDLMSEAFEDSAVKPVRFLSLVDEDGSISKSKSSSVFTSTATDVAADYIYVMPDETMYKADIIKGDVCLIRATGAIRAGVPMLVKYQGKAMLRFIITHNETNQIALRTASPYAIGTLFSTADFHDQVQVLGVLVAFRRNYKRR